MKIYPILIFLIMLGCNQSKKVEVKKTEEKPSITKEVEDVKVENKILYNELLVVLKNPEDFTKINNELISNDLSIEKIIANSKTYKAVTIKVPADKTSFWVDSLSKTDNFSTVEVNTEDALEKVNYFSKKRLVSVLKTPCFGDYPVFEVTFFNDGNVTFFGKEYTLVEGFYKFKLKENQYKELSNLFEKTAFKDFENAKDTEELQDFSNTFITYNDEKIKVKVWINIPDEIAFAYDYIEGILIDEKLIE
ncbi:hypothetical protein H9I45_01700 [Polaribacter haliotis]|uniref:DUF6438 domain-containing protein n=1 Tax=Polaribacter haliotis TaxID=1888915 RepID=A0A7L8AGP8_9FLAO|nr:DUF6438 domain-containing protein [Polaribacter haliotis]QOD61185.1 hypothetical protein H9I45_01700 [Polaribacter haliotis]